MWHFVRVAGMWLDRLHSFSRTEDKLSRSPRITALIRASFHAIHVRERDRLGIHGGNVVIAADILPFSLGFKSSLSTSDGKPDVPAQGIEVFYFCVPMFCFIMQQERKTLGKRQTDDAVK